MMRKQHGPVARSFRDGFRQVLASRQPTRKVYMRSLKNTFKLPLALALAAGFAAPAMAQEPEQGPALKRNVNLVNLFSTVRDKNKRIIGDLNQEDFKIFETAPDQKIAFFSTELNMPTTLSL